MTTKFMGKRCSVLCQFQPRWTPVESIVEFNKGCFIVPWYFKLDSFFVVCYPDIGRLFSLQHSMLKWIWIKSSLQSKWHSKPESRHPKGSKSLEIKILHGRIFSDQFLSSPPGFELTNPGFEVTTPGFKVWCFTTELRHWYTHKFVAKLSISF